MALAQTRWANLRPSGSLVRSLLLSAAVGCMTFASTARAGFSTITGAPRDEASQQSVLDHVYGGAFTLGSDGVDYSNGTLSAERVSDFLPSSSTTDNPGPNATDQSWQDSYFAANVEAAWAEYKSSPFGYIPGASGGTFQSLFSITGSAYNVTGSGSFSPGSQTFRVGAENQFGLISSLPSDNTDGKDHIVTYEINGLGDSYKTWLLFFDDYGDTGSDPDFDYQDLVIQLKTLPVDPAGSSVPEPGSFMLVGGAALALLRRARRRTA